MKLQTWGTADQNVKTCVRDGNFVGVLTTVTRVEEIRDDIVEIQSSVSKSGETSDGRTIERQIRKIKDGRRKEWMKGRKMSEG